MTLLSAIRDDGLIQKASLLIEGALSGPVFEQWVREQLVPELNLGDVVVMDNLATHKVAGVGNAIEAAGASVWYLPAYSPDMNPIEKLWSKVKTRLRQAAARCTSTLTTAVGQALNVVTSIECRNYFTACGYQR
jgi:transposase